MSARLILLRRARSDLADGADYIRRDSPAQAAAWLQRLEHSLRRLSDFPRSGVVPKDRRLAAQGYRMLVVGEHLVFYVVRGKTVQVRRVVHGKRRYAFLLHA